MVEERKAGTKGTPVSQARVAVRGAKGRWVGEIWSTNFAGQRTRIRRVARGWFWWVYPRTRLAAWWWDVTTRKPPDYYNFDIYWGLRREPA